VTPDTIVDSAAKDAAETDSEQLCVDGQRGCRDEKQVVKCTLGTWELVTICPEGFFCSGGDCIEPEQCTPGDINGCSSMTAVAKCNEAGTGYVPYPCPGGTSCLNNSGVCSEAVCYPGQANCVDATYIQQCKEDGSGWAEAEACNKGLTCVGGKCISQCLSDPKWSNSYIGCEYWSVDLDQYHDPYSPTKPDEAKHGIVIGNPGTAPAIVTFTFPAGVAFIIPEVTIEAGEAKAIPFPRIDIDGSGIFEKAVKINSNRPIVVYQYNPLDFQGAYSDDSSLLIPAEMLGKEYFAMTLGTSPLEAMPIMPAASQHGYFTVIAVEEGETKVSVKVTAIADHPMAMPGNEFMNPGSYYDFTLQQFQVLSIQADGSKMTTKTDLTGSHVIADKKVAMFSGHEEAVVKVPGCGEGEQSSGCCAEHLEEQMFPVDTWASEYLCVKAPSRGDPDKDLWRVLASQAGTQITTTPPIEGLDGKTLDQKGSWIEAYSDQSFVLTATAPVQVAQYLASRDCTQQSTGDPSLIMMVATSQYRHDYVFLVPKDYTKDYVSIVRKAGAVVTLDEVEVPDSSFKPVGNTEYEYAWVLVEDGPHHIDSDQPIGVFQYGYHNAASYGHPAGLNLIKQTTN